MNKKILIIIGISGFIILASGSFFIVGKKTKYQTRKAPEAIAELKFDKEGLKEDPFMDPNGPFFHKVYKATSTDGINFTKTGELIADKSSVPDAVKTNDGTIFIYAVDGAQRSKSGFMVARSKDNGKTWEKGSLKLKNDRIGGAGADPQAILLDDGRIRLYYLVATNKPPLDATGKPIETKDKKYIKSAISSDGINFTEEEGNRFEMTKLWTDPDVVKIGDKWFMYLSEGSKNIIATSSDGLTFTTENKSARTDGAISKTVKTDDGGYRQFYCKAGISSAVTVDGLTFTSEVISLKSDQDEILCDPAPVKIGENEWLMFYKQAPLRKDQPKKVQPLEKPLKPPL